jgi:hypothetical protein
VDGAGRQHEVVSTNQQRGPILGHWVHDCEVSAEPCVGKCHYLGTEINSDREVMDLYIHVRNDGPRTELLARWGNEGGEYLSESLGAIFHNHHDMGADSAGPKGYGVRLAYEAAVRAGYDLELLEEADVEDPSQAYHDMMMDAGNPYTDAAGMVEEGEDSIET